MHSDTTGAPRVNFDLLPNYALRIKRWADTFETAETRKKITALQWYRHPIGCASRGYRALARLNAAGFASIGIFDALCQAYAAEFRQKGRDGLFVRSCGAPMTLDDLSELIRAPLPLLRQCLAILTSRNVGWIELVKCCDPDDIRIASGYCPDDIRMEFSYLPVPVALNGFHPDDFRMASGQEERRGETHPTRARAHTHEEAPESEPDADPDSSAISEAETTVPPNSSAKTESRFNAIPTLEDVIAYAARNQIAESSARNFWSHHETALYPWNFNAAKWPIRLRTWFEKDVREGRAKVPPPIRQEAKPVAQEPAGWRVEFAETAFAALPWIELHPIDRQKVLDWANEQPEEL